MGHDATFEQQGLALQKDSEFLEICNYYRVEQNPLVRVTKSTLKPLDSCTAFDSNTGNYFWVWTGNGIIPHAF